MEVDRSTVAMLADALLASLRPVEEQTDSDRDLIDIGRRFAERTLTGDLREKYRG